MKNKSLHLEIIIYKQLTINTTILTMILSSKDCYKVEHYCFVSKFFCFKNMISNLTNPYCLA